LRSNAKKAIRSRSELHAQLILATITSSHGSYVVNFWCAFGALFCWSRIPSVWGFVTARDTTSVYPTSEPRKHRARGTQNPETPETVMNDSVPRHALQAASAEAWCATGANKMASSHHQYKKRTLGSLPFFRNPYCLPLSPNRSMTHALR
jgi:hypothetical protein